MIRTAAPLVALSLLGLAACGGSERSDTTAPPNADVVVRAEASLAWNQATYTAASHAGKVDVSLINDSGITHSMHILGSDGKDVTADRSGLGVNQSGDIASREFDLSPGTYRIVCTVPGHSSMSAVLTVS